MNWLSMQRCHVLSLAYLLLPAIIHQHLLQKRQQAPLSRKNMQAVVNTAVFQITLTNSRKFIKSTIGLHLSSLLLRIEL